MDQYAVIGNPVAHSLSPRIHALFATQCAQQVSYEKLLAALDDFSGAVRRFHADGGKGANVTLPFKLEALALCDVVSERASRAGAVNTLSLNANGQIHGDNTDGIGLLRDLEINHGLQLSGLRVLLLGAGGAARGVLGPLVDARPAVITIANRTPVKAQDLATAFANDLVLEACAYHELDDKIFDVIINSTSAGLAGDTPPLPDDVLRSGGLAYDMLYGDAPTPFMNWAAAQDAGVITNGLGMLVEQAAESFFIWRGVRPQTLPVLKMLRRVTD